MGATCGSGSKDVSLAAQMFAAWEALPDADADIAPKSKQILGCNGIANAEQRPTTSPEPKAKRRPRPRPWLPEPPSILRERLSNATPIPPARESPRKQQSKVLGAEKMVPAPKKMFPKPVVINTVEAVEMQPIEQRPAEIECITSAAMDTLDPNVSEKKLQSETSSSETSSMTANNGHEFDEVEVDNFITQDQNVEILGDEEIAILENGGVLEENNVNELEALVDEFADDDDFGHAELIVNLEEIYSWEFLQEAEDRKKQQIQEPQTTEDEKHNVFDELGYEKVDEIETFEIPYVMDIEGENDMETDSGLEAVGGMECMEVNNDDNEERFKNTEASAGDT